MNVKTHAMQRILSLLLTFVCSFLSFVDVFAQCGVKDSYDSTFTVEKRISALKTSNRRARAANISFPIWAHIIADDDGRNSITLEEIDEKK